MKINRTGFIQLNPIIDGIDGYLCVVENLRNIPFKVKRVYFIYNLNDPKAIRGRHAHRKLEQALFCVKGSFELLLDDGENHKRIIMNDPDKGVYMGPGVWHEMDNFSIDCVILVLASDYFEEKDYIRNYQKFQEFITK